MKHQTVNTDVISEHAASCKRNAIIFFICMTLLLIIINPFEMTPSNYNNNPSDDYYLHVTGMKNYSLFVFNAFTADLCLNQAVTCYLTVMLFFTSISLKQINSLQEYVIKMIDTNSLFTGHYMDAKNMIIDLKNGSYLSAQLLSFTAAINVIGFMFEIWWDSYLYINSNDDDYIISYPTMIFADFDSLTFFFRGNIIIIFIIISSSSSISSILIMIIVIIIIIIIIIITTIIVVVVIIIIIISLKRLCSSFMSYT